MRRRAIRAWGTVAAAAAVAILSSRAAEVSPPAAQADLYSQRAQPLLKKYCFECHRGPGARGEVRLDQYPTVASVLADRETWQRVQHMIALKEMPPDRAAKPSDADRKALLDWIEVNLR